MSKYHNHHAANYLHDAQCMSVDQLQDLYGIEVDEDGYVWDPLEFKEFDDIQEWAAFMDAANQEPATKIKTSGKRWSVDD